MPTPEICRSYNLIPKEYDDCINYRGHYSTPEYKQGGIKKVTGIQQKSEGGFLVGPPHEEGGIPAIVDGTEPIELEGGEYVINAQTTAALGEDFLHKLNSTETTYHQGGYQQGQLPNPSKFNRGGVTKKNSFQMGGQPTPFRKKIPAQRLREANNDCPRGMYKENGACFTITGKTNNYIQSNTGAAPILRKGGTVISKRKLQEGGYVGNQQLPSPNVRTKPSVRKRINNTVNKPTIKSIGNRTHSHILNVDVHGNGWTSYELGHEHKVRGNEVQISCPPDIKCHQH